MEGRQDLQSGHFGYLFGTALGSHFVLACRGCSDLQKRSCVALAVGLGRSTREKMIGDEGTAPGASLEPWRILTLVSRETMLCREWREG